MIACMLVGMLAALVAASGGLLGSLNRPVRLIGLLCVEVIFFGLCLGGLLYVTQQALIGPTFQLGLYVCVLAVINLVIALVARDDDEDDTGTLVGQFVVTASLIIYSLGVQVYSSGIFHADMMYGMAGKVEVREWKSDMAPVDTKHIRMVSEEQAIALGSTVLGEADRALGSKFHIGEYTIQRVDGTLAWVAPLEFNGFQHWHSSGHTTGYVVVSAEDRNVPARLIQSWKDESGTVQEVKLRHIPSAYFGDNLTRLVRNAGYRNVYLASAHFELDDKWQPWWIMPTTKPSHGYAGEHLDKILLIDPASGEITEYEPKETPAWVDHVYPEHLTDKYTKWWGWFELGWWNSAWRKDNVVEPSTSHLRMVWGADGEPYWFTGLSSASNTDDALVGFVLANSRTGKMVEYKLAGWDEDKVVKAANAQVSNFQGWHATEPILYNIYGVLAWVIPIASDSHIYQTLAIVRASDQAVVLGDTKEKALEEFRKLLASSNGNNVDPSTMSDLVYVEGSIQRISTDVIEGRTNYVLILGTIPGRIFTGTSESRPELPLTKEADAVRIGYIDTGDRVIPITTYDNLGIQEAVEAQ